MKNPRILFYLILFFTANIHAQYTILPSPKMPESVAVSTPDVMSFQKFGNIPVSLYSGKIDVDVPFYEINTGKIKIPIGLSYNSGGVKVDEIASQVGLGWTLNGTGNILTVVNDLPDGTLTYQNYAGINFPVNIGFNRRYILSDPMYNANMQWFANVDSAPDFYYVNAPGLDNVFTIDDTNYSDYQTSHFSRSYISNFLYGRGHKLSPITVQNLGAKQGIGFTGEEDGNPNLNIPTKPADVNFIGFYDFNNFEIRNEEGLVYTFSAGNFVERRTLPVLVDPTAARLDPSYSLDLNTYNLASIFDPSTQQQVDFVYETFQIAQAQRIRYLSKNNNTGTADPCNYGFIPSFQGTPIYSNEQLIKYHTATRLKKIVFNNGEVEFVYSASNRLDYDDKTLDYIKIKNIQGNIVKNFHLIYSYFDSKEGCTQKECKRLRLNQINEEYPGNTKLYYKFDYEYTNTNKLPKRFSYEQDFLGYYNNNGYTNTSFIGGVLSGPQPKLYFYPNKGAFSILPFQKTNDAVFRQITGDYSFAPNTYSLTGLLQKITYESKGFTEFEYENHTFNLDGAQYTAGGARIKKQTINDGSGNTREINYTYVETDGTSSGYISNIPVFGYPNAQITNLTAPPSQWTPFSFTTYDFDKSALELSGSNFVGYSRVVETETGNGSTESLFYSAKEYPDVKSVKVPRDQCGQYLVDNSNFPGKIFENLKEKRGTLKEKTVYDEIGNRVNKVENTYTYSAFSFIPTQYFEAYRTTNNDFYPRINIYNAYVGETSKINRERNLQTKVVTTEFLTGGDKVIEKYIDYSNNWAFPVVTQERIVNAESEIRTNTRYAFEFSSWPFGAYFVTQNRTEPVMQYVYKDNAVVSKGIVNYIDYGNNIILPSGVSTGKGTGAFENNMIIDTRDDKGNITRYHNNNDSKQTYLIWGYNKTKLIAKIESMVGQSMQNYESNLQTLSNADNDRTIGAAGNEGALRAALNNLRTALPYTMITTYTFDLIIGLTSITDPRGDVQYYSYDVFGRLQNVKDKDGNILSENEYHYKN
ncbi:MAG: RHS repeat protein [Arcicella sp.]|nr:RHS repeat protein [Arcicella sp.]